VLEGEQLPQVGDDVVERRIRIPLVDPHGAGCVDVRVEEYGRCDLDSWRPGWIRLGKVNADAMMGLQCRLRVNKYEAADVQMHEHAAIAFLDADDPRVGLPQEPQFA
jgi:hypothetical protein